MATQEELINQQFSEAMKGLGQKRKQAEDVLSMNVQRQQAMGGLTGGGAIKAAQRGQQGLEDTFGEQTAALRGQQAQGLQQVEAQKQQQQFQSGEREATQAFGTQEAEKQRQFQSAETAKERAQQGEQFQKTFGLQSSQFDEARRQFNQQMAYQLQEFNENQKTNMVNALAAIDKTRLADPNFLNILLANLGKISSKIGGAMNPNDLTPGNQMFALPPNNHYSI